ncbi:cysteine hydrolase [Betaproteobacteria bacterium GR16-43]|nr:cysteine hydrolase [Betaproteobacteria bacterium GR16-43]
MTTALLVIDVQQVLCVGQYAAFDVDGVIDRINQVSRKARAAGAPVIVIQHETKGGEMDHGSEGWKLSPKLETKDGDVFMRKTATDSFHKTELADILKSRGVTDLIICGLQSDFCVDTTTRRALGHGYPIVLVSDGHSTLDNKVLTASQIIAHHNETLSNIESFGPRVRLEKAGEVSAINPGAKR